MVITRVDLVVTEAGKACWVLKEELKKLFAGDARFQVNGTTPRVTVEIPPWKRPLT